jgi:hypothetical protein
LAQAIERETIDPDKEKAAIEELEATRKRDDDLKREVADLQALLGKSRDWLHLDPKDLERTISVGLELMGAKPLQPGNTAGLFTVPGIERLASDAAWISTIDTLRAPRRKGQPDWQWHKESPVRPVVFEDQGALDAPAVHLHLEHRFVQRLLGRFRSQGFVYDDLARACIGVTTDPVPRVILLGRLALYGDKAARLHDQTLAVAARWTDVSIRAASLKAYSEDTLDKTLRLLEESLGANPQDLAPEVRQRLASGAARDLEDLKPHLAEQAEALTAAARTALEKRGAQEAADMRAILEVQRSRIITTIKKYEKAQGVLPFDAGELRQLEADKRHWSRRLTELGRELETEPERIRASYEVKATRFEPVGLVYLWPVTG